MNVAQLKSHCAAYPKATVRLLGEPSNILVYSVGDKNFAYFKTSTPEQWRFSLRANPDRFLELTGMPGVKPARYMGRFHWVTIVDVRGFPADYLQALVAASYQRALAGPGKRLQAEVMADPAYAQLCARRAADDR